MQARNIIKNGIYKHNKGKYYKVIGIGRQTNTLDENVIYSALYNDSQYGKNALWIRKLEEFNGEVIDSNGNIMKRFELKK